MTRGPDKTGLRGLDKARLKLDKIGFGGPIQNWARGLDKTRLGGPIQN